MIRVKLQIFFNTYPDDMLILLMHAVNSDAFKTKKEDVFRLAIIPVLKDELIKKKASPDVIWRGLTVK